METNLIFALKASIEVNNLRAFASNVNHYIAAHPHDEDVPYLIEQRDEAQSRIDRLTQMYGQGKVRPS